MKSYDGPYSFILEPRDISPFEQDLVEYTDGPREELVREYDNGAELVFDSKLSNSDKKEIESMLDSLADEEAASGSRSVKLITRISGPERYTYIPVFD